MIQSINNQKMRIDLVDALKGFAVIGLLLWHSVERFCAFGNAEMNPEFLKTLDYYVIETLRFVCSLIPYSVFSLMFGFSFFIQAESGKNKGIDFRWSFLWRLTILLIVGFIVSLIYIGQILTQFALLGVILIFLFGLNRKVLVSLAMMFLLQIPAILIFIASSINPHLALDKNIVYSLWYEATQTFTQGSFSDVIKFNLWKGNVAIVSWAFFEGRIWQTLGLFILGMVLGKSKFFENIDCHKKSISNALLISVASFALLFTLYLLLPMFNWSNPGFDFSRGLIKTYYNLAFTSVLALSFILLYQKMKGKIDFSLLASFGKMSLTNYVIQPFIAVPLFYGFGLGLYRYFGETLNVSLGILILIAQLYFTKEWLKRYNYGPVEWAWRALMHFDFRMKMRRSDNMPALDRINLAENRSISRPDIETDKVADIRPINQ